MNEILIYSFDKYYNEKGTKDKFIKDWRQLEETCEKIFKPSNGTPMDELFTRYMYYERAKLGIKSSTTEALRKFYEKDSYSLLKNDETLKNLEDLAEFWSDISVQNSETFSDRVLKKLFILNYAPNGMWNYFLSVYFMQHKDNNGNLADDELYNFLNKIIPFIWAYAVVNPGVNALRTPIYAEMVNIVNNKSVDFADFKFEETQVKNMFDNYEFDNRRPITKAMLAWWAYNNPKQDLIEIDTVFDIEHIYAKNRQEKVLTTMVNNNIISEEEKAEALLEDVTPVK